MERERETWRERHGERVLGKRWGDVLVKGWKGIVKKRLTEAQRRRKIRERKKREK